MTASQKGGLCLKPKAHLKKNRHRHGARICRTDEFFIGRQILVRENAPARKANPSFSPYYFGARYLDPKYSRWMSADPALQDYIPADAESAKKLPSDGVYEIGNLSTFAYARNNPITYKDPNGMWTPKMAKAVDAAVGLDKTYTHGTWNSKTKTTEGAWDCDVFVEHIVNTADSGATMPDSWKSATDTTVAQHLKDMKDDLKDAPEKGTNIVFHGGNHAMLLSLNEDGSVDTVHISSSNKDKKASKVTWKSFKEFKDHWSKQGNGELKFVPLNDFVKEETKKDAAKTNLDNEGSGK